MIASLITTLLIGSHNAIQAGRYASQDVGYSRAELIAEARRRQLQNVRVRKANAHRRALAAENHRLRQAVEDLEAQRILDRI